MFHILTMNPISIKGLDRFSRSRYEIASEIGHPHAILVRSAKVTPAHLHPGLQAIARAGAGTDNIPVAQCSERGIAVFNTPGANANAVKELVLCGMLMAARNVVEAGGYVDGLWEKKLGEEALYKEVEGGKKKFAGYELSGKTLGVAGLGAVGSRVAETALSLGMRVLGFDPAISVEGAWRLPAHVSRQENLSALFARSDFVSLHLPLMDQTRNLVNQEVLAGARQGLVLLNFSRDGIVDLGALQEALAGGVVGRFVTDFPHQTLAGHPRVIALPHLGASTQEAEENCAMMAAEQLRDFLEKGNVVNSVNFPTLVLEPSGGFRVALVNHNVPKILGKVLGVLAEADLNVADMLNKSRGDLAYNLIDLEKAPSSEVMAQLAALEGVIAVRLLENL